VIGHPVFKDRLDEIIKETKLDFLEVQDVPVTEQVHISTFSADLDTSALIIFTSGTTGKPKGAVLTHRNIDAQASCLTKAWYWSAQDRIHHILPLHHIHGIVNALICPLYCGATVEMYQKFDATAVWSRWSDPELPKLSVFMSVPTVYGKNNKRYDKARN
jgi:acyl-CoA synthetase (AMP-forming)/AMP-acid ligase II